VSPQPRLLLDSCCSASDIGLYSPVFTPLWCLPSFCRQPLTMVADAELDELAAEIEAEKEEAGTTHNTYFARLNTARPWIRITLFSNEPACALLCAQRVPLGQPSWPPLEPTSRHRVTIIP